MSDIYNVLQTRSLIATNKSFLEAMLSPTADFGGLYTFGSIDRLKNLDSIYSLDYKQICKAVLSHLHVDIEHSMLDSALGVYDNFRSNSIIPLVEICENLYSLELYHGPTFAFKDMAISPFSRLLDLIARSQKKRYLILSATSGDTGPATLSGFANSTNIRAICMYPIGGTSDVQRLQMTTQDAKNLKVFGIEGNFDLAQSTLKSLLNSKDFIDKVEKHGYMLSVANSVNIARIAFQIPYYVSIAKNLYKKGIYDFDVIIPSGNFGNALGAFFAKKLGIGINKICIASNPNDILKEFFTTCIYDIRDKKLHLSYSPAMDILKSSNIERLLFAYLGAERTKELMDSLDKNLYFAINKQELDNIRQIFDASSFSDAECLQGIRESYTKHNYLLDPHTSNAYLFAMKRRDSGIARIQVILSTAHFAKFAKATYSAIVGNSIDSIDSISDKKILEKISDITKIPIDNAILELFNKQEIHNGSYNASTLQEEILTWLKS